MATNVFELFAKLSLDSSEFESGLTKAKDHASGFGKILSGAAKAGVAAIGAATTAVAGFAGASIKAGASFDSSMSQVAATMGFTVEELNTEGSAAAKTFEQLSSFAQEMGSTTAFSASQAADALNYMALAGYSAEKSMDMLPNVLNLAAAGGIDLAYASDMVTDAASALGLTTEQTGVMIDQFAAAASKSNTSVAQLGEAILTIGATAANVKGGTQELSTVLGALADNGIKGSEGGTHLRNMLLSLQTAAENGKVAFGDFSVQVYDADGNMRSMIDIIEDMKSGMNGMSQEAKDALISGVFNKTDLSSINALLNTSTERFEELGAAIEDSAGAAEDMAKIQLDNLQGDITLFKSALEGAQIAISDELTPSLREFVQFGSQGLSDLTAAFKEGGLSGAMESFGNILSEGLTMVVEGLPSAVNAGLELLKAVGQGIMDNIDVIVFAAWDVVETLMNSLVDATSGQESKIYEILSWIVGAFVENSMGIIDAGFQLIENLALGMANALPEYIPEMIDRIFTIFERLLQPGNISKLVNAGVSLIKGLLQGLINGAKMLIAWLPSIIKSVLDALKTAVPQIMQAAIDLIGMLVESLPEIISGLLNAIPDIIQMVVDTLVTLLPVLIDGVIQLVTMLADNLPQILTAIIDALPMIIQSVIDGLMELIPALVQGAIQLTIGVLSHLPEIIAAIIQAIPQIIEAIITGFMPLSDRVVELFSNIGTAISDWWSQKKADIANGWTEFIGNVKTWFEQLPYNLGYALADMIVKLGEWYTEAKEWVATSVSKFIESIVNWFAGLPNKIWNWLSETIKRIGTWITDTDAKVKAELPVVIEGIVKFFEELPGRAWDWGVDMINNFISGIGAMAQQAWDAVEGFAQGIADRLGFSEPELGPLSDFHTYAPDMMDLFAQGIRDNADVVNDAIADNFDFSDAIVSPEVDYQQVYQSNTEGALNQMISLLQQLVDKDYIIEPDEANIFRVVEKQNRQRTKATGYNSLAMVGGQ